jgi:hypothetical protein
MTQRDIPPLPHGLSGAAGLEPYNQGVRARAVHSCVPAAPLWYNTPEGRIPDEGKAMTGSVCRIALGVLLGLGLHASGQNSTPPPLLEGILEEIRLLPPALLHRAGAKEEVPPMPAKALAGYQRDNYKSVGILRDRFKKHPKNFAMNFPLRAAFFETVQVLEDSQKLALRQTLEQPIQPKHKADILKMQQQLGMAIFELEQLLSRLKEAEADRANETSKRWQANFDFALARLESRLVHLLEYNYVLAQVRSDNLPELTGKQPGGWRLAPRPTLSISEAKAKQLNKDLAKRCKKIEEEYPDTPWAVLARRDGAIGLGLEWRPRKE